ncbi:hypothetical protein [Streptomyces sp. NPDC055013]
MTLRRLLNGAAALTLTTVAVLAGGGQAQAEGGSWAGCPYGVDLTPINSILLREHHQ